MNKQIQLKDKGSYFYGCFFAMAGPCELLMDTNDKRLAEKIIRVAHEETKRIENKFSRYQKNNLMHQINSSKGKTVEIDQETFNLLEFANTCFDLSDGLFDITSGVLRQAWKFDCSNNIPDKERVSSLLNKIGWKQVDYSASSIKLPNGFELDFGGIGKEYAVGRAASLCNATAPELSVLVNFGGDIEVTKPRKVEPYWQVGIEDPRNKKDGSVLVKIAEGGLATSGDANRYLLKNDIRYSHILNPKTGYPISDAPRSVTVAAQNCVQSGLLATLAMLQGADAETFLQNQDVKHWCFR